MKHPADNIDRIICVGVNPAFDITMKLTSLRCGEVSRVYSEKSVAAGKALNVAKALSRAGIGADYICLLGEDNSGAYIAELDRLGIRYEAVMCPGRTRENLTLLADGAEKEYKINRDGFRAGEEQTERLAQIITRSAGIGAVMIFSGSMPPGMDAGDYEELMLAAKRAGARLAIDTEALSMRQLIGLSPWLYKPNQTELCRLLGMEYTDDEELLAESAAKLGQSGVENILLTLGVRGLMLIGGFGSSCERVYASEKKLKDSTGAGDRALAGFVLSRLKGGNYRECAENAAALAQRTAEE